MITELMIWIVAGLLLLGLTLLIFVAHRDKNKEGRKPNYRLLFILGICWLPIGIATRNPALWGLGSVFFIIGVANKDKWEKDKKWSELSPAEKKIKFFLMIFLGLLLIVGLVLYLLAQNNLLKI